MTNTKKRTAHRPVQKKYLFNSIIFYISEFFKEKHVEITIGLIMAIVWLSGFLLGAMMMFGGLSV